MTAFVVQTITGHAVPDGVVTFVASEVTLHFTGNVQYRSGYSRSFTKPTMSLFPGTYGFRFGNNTYPRAEIEITVPAGTGLEQSIVYLQLLDDNGDGIAGGTAE